MEMNENQMEKHLRCNMRTSKAPFPHLGKMSLPPPPIPTTTTRQHETRQRREETARGRRVSASRPHPSSAPQDEPEQHFPTQTFIFWGWEGDKGVCG